MLLSSNRLAAHSKQGPRFRMRVRAAPAPDPAPQAEEQLVGPGPGSARGASSNQPAPRGAGDGGVSSGRGKTWPTKSFLPTPPWTDSRDAGAVHAQLAAAKQRSRQQPPPPPPRLDAPQLGPLLPPPPTSPPSLEVPGQDTSHTTAAAAASGPAVPPTTGSTGGGAQQGDSLHATPPTQPKRRGRPPSDAASPSAVAESMKSQRWRPAKPDGRDGGASPAGGSAFCTASQPKTRASRQSAPAASAPPPAAAAPGPAVHASGADALSPGAVPGQQQQQNQQSVPVPAPIPVTALSDVRCRRAFALNIVTQVDPRKDKVATHAAGVFFLPIQPTPTVLQAALQREEDCAAALVARGLHDLSARAPVGPVGPEGGGGGEAGALLDMYFPDLVGLLLQLPRGQPAFAQQVKVGGVVGGGADPPLVGVLDFLLLRWSEAGTPWLHIIECKDSSSKKTSHEEQAFWYCRLVQLQLRLLHAQQEAVGPLAGPGAWAVAELRPEQVTFEVLRDGEDGRPEQPLMAPPLDPSKLEAVTKQYMQGDVVPLVAAARAAVATGSAEAVHDYVTKQPFVMSDSKCRSCGQRPYCMADAQARAVLELLELNVMDNKRMRAAGLRTVWDVADLDLAGQQAGQLLEQGFGRDLSRVKDRARAWAAMLPPPSGTTKQEQVDKYGISGLRYLTAPGASTLPPWRGTSAPPLVRVFLTLHFDYIRKTFNSLAAHVTCSTAGLSTYYDVSWEEALRSGPDSRSLLTINRQPYAEGDYAGNRALDRQLLEGFFREVFTAVEQVGGALAERSAAAEHGNEGGGGGSGVQSPPPPPPILQQPLHFFFDSRGALEQLVSVVKWSAGLQGAPGVLESLLGLLGLREGPEEEQRMFSLLDEELPRQMTSGSMGKARWQLGSMWWETQPWLVKAAEAGGGQAPKPGRFRTLRPVVAGKARDLPKTFGMESSFAIPYDTETRRLLPKAHDQRAAGKARVASHRFELDILGDDSANPDVFARYRAAVEPGAPPAAQGGDVGQLVGAQLPLLLEQEPWLQRWIFERLNFDWEMVKSPVDLREPLRIQPPRPLPTVLRNWISIDHALNVDEKRAELLQATPLSRHRLGNSILVANVRPLGEEARSDPWVRSALQRLRAEAAASNKAQEASLPDERGGGAGPRSPSVDRSTSSRSGSRSGGEGSGSSAGSSAEADVRDVWLCEVDEGGYTRTAAGRLAFRANDFVRVHAREGPDPSLHQRAHGRDVTGFDAVVEEVEAGQPQAGSRRRILLRALRRYAPRQGKEKGDVAAALEPRQYFLMRSSPREMPFATLDKSWSDFPKNAVHNYLKSLGEAKERWLEELLLQGGLATPPEDEAVEACGSALESVHRLALELQRTELPLQEATVTEGGEGAAVAAAALRVLSEEQAGTVLRGLSSSCQLVQGPPGTGKTQLLAAAILLRLVHDCAVRPPLPPHSARKPPLGRVVLVAAPTNNAADVVLTRLAALAPHVRLAAQRQGLPPPPEMTFVRFQSKLPRAAATASDGAAAAAASTTASDAFSDTFYGAPLDSSFASAEEDGDDCAPTWSGSGTPRGGDGAASTTWRAQPQPPAAPTPSAFAAAPSQPACAPGPSTTHPPPDPIRVVLSSRPHKTLLNELRADGRLLVVACTVSGAMKLADFLRADRPSLDPWVSCPLALLALDETSMMTSADAVALLALFQMQERRSLQQHLQQGGGGAAGAARDLGHQQQQERGQGLGRPGSEVVTEEVQGPQQPSAAASPGEGTGGWGGGAARHVAVLAVGDPKQLRPITKVDPRTETRPEIAQRPDLASSAFDLLAAVPGPLRSGLSESNRFGPVTSLLLSATYRDDRIQLRSAAARTEWAAARKAAAGAAGAGNGGGDAAGGSLLQLPVESSQAVFSRLWSQPDELLLVLHDEAESSEQNALEVEIIRQLLCAAPPGRLPPSSVGLVTLRTAQRRRLSDMTCELPPPWPANPLAVAPDDANSVDGFQGADRRLMVASFCTSSPECLDANPAFYLDANRFNVMMSRHKEQLVLVVGRRVLRHLPTDAEVWARMELLPRFATLVSRPIGVCEIEGELGGGEGGAAQRHRVEVFGVDPRGVGRLQLEADAAWVETRKQGPQQ